MTSCHTTLSLNTNIENVRKRMNERKDGVGGKEGGGEKKRKEKKKDGRNRRKIMK